MDSLEITQDLNHQLQTAATASCLEVEPSSTSLEGQTLVDNASSDINAWFNYTTATIGLRHSATCDEIVTSMLCGACIALRVYDSYS